MNTTKRSLNQTVLLIFAPLLIIVGIAGLVIPADKSLTSGAIPYDIFHICFGIVGVIILLAKSVRGAIIFNIGFGLIDLYQAVASYFNLFPKSFFLWTGVDDILHIVIGLILVIVGLYGELKGGSSNK